MLSEEAKELLAKTKDTLVIRKTETEYEVEVPFLGIHRTPNFYSMINFLIGYYGADREIRVEKPKNHD